MAARHRCQLTVDAEKTADDNFAEFECAIQEHIKKLERAQEEAAYNKALDELYSPDPDAEKKPPPSLADTFNFELAEFFEFANERHIEDLDPQPSPMAMALLKELTRPDIKKWDWERIRDIWNAIMEEEYTLGEVKLCLGNPWSRDARIRVTRLVWTAMFMGERDSIPK